MGFFFRQSIKFGPIRFNFSKSGIGVSAGIKGLRVSTGPRGTYVNAGRNGFYYRQKIDGRGVQQSPPSSPPIDNYASQDSHHIHTADVTKFIDSSNAKLIEQINTASSQFRFSPWVGGATGISALLVVSLANSILLSLTGNAQVTGLGAIICAAIVIGLGSYLTWRVHRGDELKRTTPLFYELSDEQLQNFSRIKKAGRYLARAHRIWRVQTQQSTWDWKRNAGASSIITRTNATVRPEQPPYIATNVEVWSLALSDQTLYFMPDYILVRQNKQYGAISYKSFLADFAPTRFIEDQGVPTDTRILEYTWQYVNKKGGPDRRFSNNKQIPIVEYGFVHLSTASGLNVHLHVSNINAASGFSQLISGHSPRSQQFNESQNRTNRSNAVTIDPKIRDACETLGISIDSTTEQIVAAYRQMAKMYHPDRLQHLAPEFIEMAELRMKEINIAYDYLKQNNRL